MLKIQNGLSALLKIAKMLEYGFSKMLFNLKLSSLELPKKPMIQKSDSGHSKSNVL